MSTTSWILVHGKPEPVYVIKYAESVDGIEWRRENPTCIPARSPTEAIARPWIVRESDRYRMWYCHRETVDFRTDPRASYHIGYAESADGVSWERKDDEVGIDLSDDGWDSDMIEYPAVYSHGGTMHLLYNGNGFGAAGIGHAVLEAE